MAYDESCMYSETRILSIRRRPRESKLNGVPISRGG